MIAAGLPGYPPVPVEEAELLPPPEPAEPAVPEPELPCDPRPTVDTLLVPGEALVAPYGVLLDDGLVPP